MIWRQQARILPKTIFFKKIDFPNILVRHMSSGFGMVRTPESRDSWCQNPVSFSLQAGQMMMLGTCGLQTQAMDSGLPRWWCWSWWWGCCWGCRRRLLRLLLLLLCIPPLCRFCCRCNGGVDAGDGLLLMAVNMRITVMQQIVRVMVTWDDGSQSAW